MRIVINGIGIAGSTLAYWLRKSGHAVTLVEEAPRLRSGGYIIDFWGVGYDIAERMGLIPVITELGYQVSEVRFVDRDGHRNGGFSTDVFQRLTHGRFTSLRRSDLAAAIFSTLDESVETIFGDSVASVHEVQDCVRVSFVHAPARDADLVIGADGLHSRVRQLAFGPEGAFDVPLGYHVAAFELEGYLPRDELTYVSYAVPGRQVSRFAMREDKTLFLFVFRDEYLRGRTPTNPNERREALTTVYADVGWETPMILSAMDDQTDIYFDIVKQVRMAEWSAGRTALLGDAAACVSLMAGEGSGLAMAEAYVLAGELRANDGDHVAAFARYQEWMMPLLRQKQQSAMQFASAFAPKTSVGLSFRNLVTGLLKVPPVADFFIGRDLRDNVEIPDYGY